jgi:hypothetical protein
MFFFISYIHYNEVTDMHANARLSFCDFDSRRCLQVWTDPACGRRCF